MRSRGTLQLPSCAVIYYFSWDEQRTTVDHLRLTPRGEAKARSAVTDTAWYDGRIGRVYFGVCMPICVSCLVDPKNAKYVIFVAGTRSLWRTIQKPLPLKSSDAQYSFRKITSKVYSSMH